MRNGSGNALRKFDELAKVDRGFDPAELVRLGDLDFGDAGPGAEERAPGRTLQDQEFIVTLDGRTPPAAGGQRDGVGCAIYGDTRRVLPDEPIAFRHTPVR